MLTTQEFAGRPISSQAQLSHLLLEWGHEPGDFLILATDDEHYLQVAHAGEGYLVERRDGDAASHSYAIRPSASETDIGPNAPAAMFSREALGPILMAYFAEKPIPDVRWQSSGMDGYRPTYGIAAIAIFMALLVLAVLFFMRP